MPAQPSHAAAASSDDEDALPPSMHESLRDGLDSSDSSSSERRDNPRDERYDAVPLHEDSVEDGHANVKAVEESEKLLYQEKPSKHAGSEGKAKKQKHRQRKNSSSNVTGEKMKLKLEQSALRKRRRVSSAIAQARERLFFGVQPCTALVLLIPFAIALVVLSYLFGSPYAFVQNTTKINSHAGLRSNGTHWFNNTVIIVSFDGFKPSYLNRNLTPHLLQVSEKGLRAEYMRSIFPTLTFPNHWAIQTGLYAESHGIVGNDFFDPTDNTEFYFTGGDTSIDPKWWFGEPMWETVVKNGLKSASIMWPGPPIMMSGISPTYHRPFQMGVGWKDKKDQIAQWLDLPDNLRPQLICNYLPEIDQQGHAYGPDSDEMNRMLHEMDKFSSSLHSLLEERNLLDIVDVLYVSDHGMVETANERVVYLDEVLGQDGFDAIEHKEGWPSCGLRFKPGTNETLMVERMMKGVEESNGGYHYYTHETMPEDFHFKNSPRIAPHYLVPEVGWAISDKSAGWYQAKGRYTPYGNHGYDRDHPDMHAIFIAHGPFAQRIKATHQSKRHLATGVKKNTVSHRLPSNGSTSSSSSTAAINEEITVIPGFDNLEIYNLVTKHLLKLDKTAPNNGTAGFWETILEVA